MKFLATLSLGLFALNAMALPVLREPVDAESIHVFKDHEDSEKLYYIPDEASLYQLLSSGEPLFHIFKIGDERYEERIYRMHAAFKAKNSEPLQGLIDKETEAGKDVSILPILSSYVVMDNSNLVYSEYETLPSNRDLESMITLKTSLSEEGFQNLKLYLGSSSEKVELAEYCYEVSGLTPKMNGSVKINYAQVMAYFSKKHIDSRPFTKKEIKETIEVLMDSNWITLSIKGGDATKGDYAFLMGEKLIPEFFTPSGDGRFMVVNKFAENKFVNESFVRRELVTKEYCLGLNFAAAKIQLN